MLIKYVENKVVNFVKSRGSTIFLVLSSYFEMTFLYSNRNKLTVPPDIPMERKFQVLEWM